MSTVFASALSFVKFGGKGGVGDIYKTMDKADDIVLGHQFNIDVRGKGHGTLVKYQKITGGRTYYSWQETGLTKYDPYDPAQFMPALDEAMTNSNKIHFGLDSLNLKKTYELGESIKYRNGFDYPANYTAYEFRTIIDNPQFLNKAVFWQNGKAVSTESVLNRLRSAGIEIDY